MGSRIRRGGNLLISDSGNHYVNVLAGLDDRALRNHQHRRERLYRLGGNGGSAYVGDGYQDNVNSQTAPGSIDGPQGLAADPTDARSVFVVDTARNDLRKIDTTNHLVFTWAGTLTSGGGNDGVVARGWEWHAEPQRGRQRGQRVLRRPGRQPRAGVRRVGRLRPNGLGDDGRQRRSDGSNALLTSVNSPSGVALDNASNPTWLYVVDTSGEKVRRVALSSGAIVSSAPAPVPGTRAR